MVMNQIVVRVFDTDNGLVRIRLYQALSETPHEPDLARPLTEIVLTRAGVQSLVQGLTDYLKSSETPKF